VGPLRGIVVVEFAAIGPVPFCGQLLADLGADVVVVERVDGSQSLRDPRISGRSKRSIGVDLKHQDGLEVVGRLVALADVVLEGYRPGVMERLGIGPEAIHATNPRCVYGRMTGWGHEGPMAQMAGHDINYLSMVGALASIGTTGQPIPPLNLVADYGGGAMYLAVGVLAALVERSASGLGQVVDAAMVDGTASLMDVFYTMDAIGMHDGPRGTNFLDGGAPFYRAYATSDGRWVAVGALEPAFFAALLDGLGLDAAEMPGQWDTVAWPELADAIGSVFATASRDEWAQRFDGTDACVTPVLERAEVPAHPVARRSFVDLAGTPAPAPAPRFDRTPARTPVPLRRSEGITDGLLERLGYDAGARERLHQEGRVR
jgi:alpha-methylacyl-CoA racemase